MRTPEITFSRRARLPVIRSAENAECGLACVAMIANYHGHQIDLVSLRQRFPTSMSGAAMRGLIQVCEALELSARPIRLEMAELGRLRLPAVLHWDLNHFVVLARITGDKATIHDPARGERSYALSEISKHFTGAALELGPIGSFVPIKEQVALRIDSLWSRMEGFWAGFSQIMALSIAMQVAAFAAPFLLQLVVDEAIGRSDADLLVVLAIGFGFLLVLQPLIEALRAWTLQIFGQSLLFQVSGNLVHHLLRLPSDYFEKRHVGDILSRMASVGALQDMLSKGIVSSIIDGVTALLALVVLFAYSPKLAAIVVLAVLVSLCVSLGCFPFVRQRTESQLMEGARERTHLMETVRAATTIKLMGRESEREAQWRNLYANVINASTSVAKYNLGLAATHGAIAGVQFILVVYFGAKAVLAGDGFSIGMLMAFLAFRQIFTDRSNSLIDQVLQFKLLGLHLERLSDIFGVEKEAANEQRSPRLAVKGAIEVENLSFRYGATEAKVLDEAYLSVAAGEYLAITGVSGGGKSTLLKLMLGLRQPENGEIRLDGTKADPALWRAWREDVGVVAQDDRLLSGSIADNIGFFDPEADMDRIEAAARAARIHDDIVAMPMQYLSLVGDMGSSLSGGQKQRVLLARALYRNPSILFLDEGTANLDRETEAEIADLIASLPITRIIVAHRPALLRRAHRVITVSQGKLYETKLNFGGGEQRAPASTG